MDASGQQETAEALKALERLDGRVRTLPAAGRTPGAARNEGLRAARGAYCFFPDAGDRLEADTLNVAWNLAEAEQLDVTVLPSAIHDGLRAGATVSGGVWVELLPEKRPFAAEDVAQNLFQAVQTRVWDKLWRTAFLREKKLAFGEGDCGGDLPLVLPAVAQAARMDYVTGMPRIQHGLGEKVRTEEAPDTFYRMLLRTREGLQKAGVYERREQDFENFALHYALEQMTCQTPEAYPEIYGQMQSRWLEELGVLFRPRIYFFSGDDFKLMNRLRQENAVDYLLLTVRESRERLEALSRLPSAEEEMTKSPVYRAGMRVTWLPRKMRSAGRLLKEEGVGGTLRYALGKTPAP